MSLMKIITEEEMTYSGQSGVDGVKKSQQNREPGLLYSDEARVGLVSYLWSFESCAEVVQFDLWLSRGTATEWNSY